MNRQAANAGFSLVDMLMAVTVVGIVAAMATPVMNDLVDGMRLGQGAREISNELQTARLKAVTSNRPIRVRFNCPVAGQYRMVELIGSPAAPAAADTAANRCQDTVYPSPPVDANPLTRPNHDGPVRRLPPNVTFGAISTLEFWPDGSVHRQAAAELPWDTVPPAGTAITVVKAGKVKSITVNGVGKVQLAQ